MCDAEFVVDVINSCFRNLVENHRLHVDELLFSARCTGMFAKNAFLIPLALQLLRFKRECTINMHAIYVLEWPDSTKGTFSAWWNGYIDIDIDIDVAVIVAWTVVRVRVSAIGRGQIFLVIFLAVMRTLEEMLVVKGSGCLLNKVLFKEIEEIRLLKKSKQMCCHEHIHKKGKHCFLKELAFIKNVFERLPKWEIHVYQAAN